MSSTSAQTPIPSRPDGYALGSGPATAPVVLDAFFDLLCPDSSAAWPTIKKVIAVYPTQLYFLLHTFPLPYHTNSFIANQGMHVIDRASHHNASALLAYTDLLFDIQQDFYNAATADKTITQVIVALASAVETGGLLPSAAFVKGIADSGINEETRVSWKYGCSRAVTGTPSFLLNGVFVNADASWQLSDWQSIIDPIIKAEQRLDLTFAHHRTASLLHAPHAAAQLNSTCPPNTKECDYAPNEMECCKPGEGCIPNVGCRCSSIGEC
jgi:hypothetical protein